MAENYGFEHRVLRFVQIRQIRAEKRPKSEGKIWNIAKNVVPLHCQSEDRRALKMRDTKRDVGHPMQLAASESNTM